MNKKPNVVFILIDDLGYGDISSFNENSKISTKNIDKLAENGMRFTDAHSTSPLCSPARYGLLTGRYNFRSKMKLSVLTGDSYCLIEKDCKTLPMLFKENNYNTACVGKWHLGLDWQLKNNPKPSDFGIDEKQYDFPVKRQDDMPWIELLSNKVAGIDIDYDKPIKYGPNNYGFDYFLGIPASIDQPPYVLIENDKVINAPNKAVGKKNFNRFIPEENLFYEYGPGADDFDFCQINDDLNDKVLDLIDEYSEKEEPFFIYYPTLGVHTPFLVNDEFKGKSGLNEYADFVLQIDDYVGKITKKLKEKGVLEDTIIVFTSDNGCSPAADYPFLTSKGHNPSYVFKGTKSSMYEGGHRIPTIFYWNNNIEKNTICDVNICQTDFFKTFASILNTEVNEKTAVDSFDLSPLLFNNGKYERKATVCNSSYGYLGLIKGNYKLMCCEQDGTSIDLIKHKMFEPNYKPKLQLYNLKEDISETHNIFDEEEGIVEDLMCELRRIIGDGRQNKGEKQSNFTPKYWPQIDF